jgi:hypothetical protein
LYTLGQTACRLEAGMIPAKLPLANRSAKLSLIHIAKDAVGITDDAYRALLSGAAGVNSAAKLEYEYQFNAVMKAFEKLGFKSSQRSAGVKTRPRWPDSWGGTPNQRAKIEVMWKTYARNPGEKALRAFIKRIAGVDHPRWLNEALAQKVIIALEAMARKAAVGKEEEQCSS